MPGWKNVNPTSASIPGEPDRTPNSFYLDLGRKATNPDYGPGARGRWQCQRVQRRRLSAPGRLGGPVFCHVDSDWHQFRQRSFRFPKGRRHGRTHWPRSRNPERCDGLFVPANLKGQGMTARVLSGLPWMNLSDHNPLEVTWDGPLVLDQR